MQHKHIDKHEIIENLKKSVNENNFTYNEMLKIFCNFPVLYTCLDESKWDLTMAYYVAHNQPEYFGCIPDELITREMYKSYLMNGARKLKRNFTPIVLDKFIELKEAIFLLRSYNIFNINFEDNKKYKYHVCKHLEKAQYTNHHYRCIYDKIIANPQKFIGKNQSRDHVIFDTILYFEYNYEDMKKIFDAYDWSETSNIVKAYITSHHNYQRYISEKFNESNEDDKNKILTDYFELMNIKSKDDLEKSVGYYDIYILNYYLTNEVLSYKYTFPNGDTYTFKAHQWLYKLIRRVVESFFTKGETK